MWRVRLNRRGFTDGTEGGLASPATLRLQHGGDATPGASLVDGPSPSGFCQPDCAPRCRFTPNPCIQIHPRGIVVRPPNRKERNEIRYENIVTYFQEGCRARLAYRTHQTTHSILGVRLGGSWLRLAGASGCSTRPDVQMEPATRAGPAYERLLWLERAVHVRPGDRG